MVVTARRVRLRVERLECREVFAVAVALVGNVLQVNGSPGKDRIDIDLNDGGDQLIVRDRGVEVGRFDVAAVARVDVAGGAGDDVVRVGGRVTTPVNLDGGGGRDKLIG